MGKAARGPGDGLVEYGLVWTPGDLGLGRVIALEADWARVQFMHSLVRTEERDFRQDDLRRARLPAQTRVYVKNEGRVYLGRIVHGQVQDDGLYVYQVRFPNDVAAPVPERFVKVRCLAPIADAADSLVAAGMDSQFIHDRRARILEHVIKGRAGSRSFAGLLSASVELYPHQLEVVRRVTDDALQRYLLADEVGLGKTIEAAGIVRQHLLENPDADVLVLARKNLIGQWKSELVQRFHLEDFGEAIRVMDHAALGPRLEPPSLLVVDEVHHLVGQEALGYAQLVRLAHESPRVLLLSATPVMDDAIATLRLFHLLDPSAYRLEDPQAFTERVSRRQEIGRLLLVLASSDDDFVMSRAVEIGRGVLRDDPEAQALLDELDRAVATKDSISLLGARARTREYLTDTYQLSKRMLRTRRRDLAEKGLLTRGGPVVVEALDSDQAGLAEALDDWRLECSAQLYAMGIEDPDRREAPEVADRRETSLAAFRALLESVAVSSEAVQECIGSQLERASSSPLFPGEIDYLKRISEREQSRQLDLEVRCQLIYRELRRLGGLVERPKVVVFTSSPSVATAIHARMPALLGYGAAFLLTPDLHATNAVVQEFARKKGPAVLIADRSGEEGLNLQFADSVIHMDLPISVMRVEQRMGRLDRIGRGSRPIRHFAVLPVDSAADPWSAWMSALLDGFKVFSESVADLQFTVLDLENRVLERILLSGSISEADLEALRKGIASERERLDERYALDAEQLFSGEALQQLQDVAAIDRSDEALGKAMSDWWEVALGLVRDDMGSGAFRLGWEESTKLPEDPWRKRVAPCLGQPLTYEREAALAVLGTRLVRTGAALVDAVPTLLRYDDRGSAYATWRTVPALAETGEEWIVFKCQFVVEVDVAAVRAQRLDKADPALQRRVDRLAPPWIETVYLDSDLRPLVRPDLLAAVQGMYSKADVNLGSRPELLGQVIPAGTYPELVRSAASAAEQMLVASHEFQRRRGAAIERARVAVGSAEAKLRRMQDGSHRLGEAQSQLDDDVRRLLEEAGLVTNLRPRLDSIGITFLSGAAPS